MRSIGKVKIRRLNKLVDSLYYTYKSELGEYELSNKIKDSVPSEWFDIWESAWCEIERLINDRLCKLRYGKVLE